MSNTQLYRKVYCSRALPHKSGYYDSEHGKLYYDKKTEVWGLDSKPKYWLEPVQDHSREQDKWIDVRITLPPISGYYIAMCTTPCKEPGLIHFHPDTGWQNGFYEVSHWMPLPKLPKPTDNQLKS